MMTPRSSPIGSVLAIRSAPSRSTLKVPIRLMSTTMRKRSSGKTPSLPSTRIALPVPAQLTTMRSGPSDSAISRAAATAFSSVTSAGAERARSPSSRTTSSPLRSSTTTWAPASSSRLVVARPRPDAPPVTSATASLISTRASFPPADGWADLLVGWGLYPVAEDGFGVGSRLPRRSRLVGDRAGKPRGRPRLQPAVGLVEGVALGDMRLGLHLAERQHRCHAGIGIGEHFGPVVAVLRGEHLGEPGPQLGPAGAVVLAGQVGGVQAEALEQFGVELRLDGADRDIAAVGAFVGVVVRGAGVQHVGAALVGPHSQRAHPPHHLDQHRRAVDHRRVDDLA